MLRRSSTSWYRIISLVIIPTLLGVVSAPTPSKAFNIVERWRGTIAAFHSFNLDEFAGDLAPLYVRERYTLTYNLQVDDTGFFNGDIVATPTALSIEIPGNTCVGGQVTQCTVTLTPLQSTASWFVEGQRFIDDLGQPSFKVRNVVDEQPVTLVRRTCGLFLGAFKICIEGEETWSAEYVDDFVITPSLHGRPALASPRVRTVKHDLFDMEFRYTGHLLGVGQEPQLELDRELLERSTFIAQVPVEETLDTNIDWNSADAGWVTWQLGKEAQRRTGPTRSGSVPEKVNIGLPQPGRFTAKVQAQNTLGLTSRPATTQITAAPPPNQQQFPPPAEIVGTKQGDIVGYKFKFKFPDPHFEMRGNVPAVVPFFGAAALGIGKTQISGEVDVKSTGEGFAKGEAETEFEAMKGKLKGSGSLKAEVILDQSGIRFPKGELEVKIAGKIKAEEPLLALIPPLAAQVNAVSRISPAADKIIKKAVFRIEIEPKISLIAKLKNNNGLIDFVAGQAKPAMGIKGMIVLELIKDVAEVQAGVGGEASFIVQFPAPYFQGAEVKLSIFAKLLLYHWAYDFEASHTERVPAARNMAVDGSEFARPTHWQQAESETAETWTVFDRAYLDDEDYAEWTAPEWSPTQPWGNPNPVDEQLVANIFPQANPALAAVSNADGLKQAILAWTHDRPGTAALSGQEIAYARNRDGRSWGTEPVMLTRDNRADFNPKVLFMANGDELIGWQRFDTAMPGDLNNDPAGYFSHIQVAAARPGFAEAPRQISTSGSINHRAQFSATDTGAISVWINNPANLLIGDATNPDQLMFAHFSTDNARWSSPASAIGPIAGLRDFELATAGPHMALVYNQDTDGNLETTADLELFYTRFENNAWSTPVRITNNQVADEAPQLALTAQGTPVVVWRQNGQLVFLRGTWASTPSMLVLEHAATGTDFQLVRGQDGGLALVWQEVEADHTRIGYSIFDAASNNWSPEQTLALPASTTGETLMAANITPALITGSVAGAQDQLMAAYQLTSATTVTRTSDGVTIPNVPVPGKQSLHVVRQRVQTNLSVSPADLVVSPPDAQPGQPITVTAAIHNTGHTDVADVPVTLVREASELGDSNTVIMTQTLPLLRAGSTHTMTFTLTQPTVGSSPYAIHIPVKIVERPGRFPDTTARRELETNYRDNYATIGSELEMSPRATLYMPEGAFAVAEVAQRGLYSTAETTATVRLGAPDGPLVAELPVSFPATHTATLSLTQWISTTNLGMGSHSVYWEVDSANRRGERTTIDNATATRVNVYPDLETDAALVGWGHEPGPTAPVSLRVLNEGNWPAEGGVAAIFDGEPGMPGTRRIGEIAIPRLEPGDFAELTGTLNLTGLPAAANGLSQIYVQLDPADSIPELNENNNLTLASSGPWKAGPGHHRVVMPLIRR